MLELRGVSVDGRLGEVSFRAQAGQIVGIQGPNASGKSTLLDVVAGQVRPSSGVIKREQSATSAGFRGCRSATSAGFRGCRSATSPGVGRAPAVSLLRQDPALPPHLRVDRLLRMMSQAARVENPEPTRVWLERFELTHVSQHRVAELSGGQRARLGLALAFSSHAGLVALDEPLAAIASESRSGLLDAIAEASKERLVLMVSHEPTDFSRLPISLVVALQPLAQQRPLS